MKYVFKCFLIVTAISFSSCATIINGETQKIKVSIDSNITKFKIYDSLNTNNVYTESNTYEVLRSENPLYLRIQFDTTFKTISLKSHSSLAYWLNVIANNSVGLIGEMDSPSRYSYPDKIKLEVQNGDLFVRKSSASNAGTLNLHFSIPYINTFYLQQNNKKDVSAGFLGIGTGLDFFYNDKNNITLNAGVATDFPFFVPVPIDQVGTFEKENSSTTYVNLKNHHQFGSIDVGFGLQYSTLFWQKQYFEDAGIPASPVKVENFKSSNLGISFSAHIFTSEYFKFGVLYHPTLLSISPETKLNYQHFASFELGWRIPLWTFD